MTISLDCNSHYHEHSMIRFPMTKKNMLHRFDGDADLTEKVDPTLKKTFSMNELGIQLLFAAANGDLLAIRRCESRM